MTRDGIPMLMLIDDEPAQRRLVSALASRAGWRTIFAQDGETAIAMLGTLVTALGYVDPMLLPPVT